MTNRAAKIYSFTMAAGGTFQVLAEGSYYKLLAAAGDVSIARNGGTDMALSVGQGEKDAEFKYLTIRDLSGAANAGRVVVADNTFVDDSVQGLVEVIDGDATRALAGAMFMATPSQAAVAGQLPHTQLWNPAASGVNLIVTALGVQSTSLNQFGVGFNSSALATNMTATTLINKKGGAAIGQAQARAATNAAALVSAIGQSLYVIANGYQAWPIKGCIVVPPGQGLVLYAGQANTSMAANFEFFEQAE